MSKDEKAAKRPSQPRLLVRHGSGGGGNLLFYCPQRRTCLGVLGGELERSGVRVGERRDRGT